MKRPTNGTIGFGVLLLGIVILIAVTLPPRSQSPTTVPASAAPAREPTLAVGLPSVQSPQSQGPQAAVPNRFDELRKVWKASPDSTSRLPQPTPAPDRTPQTATLPAPPIPDKTIEQGRSIDNRLAEGGVTGIGENELGDTLRALQAIREGTPQYAEARRLEESIEQRVRREAQQAAREVGLPVIDDVRDCGRLKFEHQHAACFDREYAKLPKQDRERLESGDLANYDLAGLREALVQADRSERELDAAFAGAARAGAVHVDEATRTEAYNVLRAARSPKELSVARARFCALGHGEPEIGMTEDEAIRTSWCVPIHFNETVTAGHIRRQYVYGPDFIGEYQVGNTHEGHLYFEDGRLVAIQRR